MLFDSTLAGGTFEAAHMEGPYGWGMGAKVLRLSFLYDLPSLPLSHITLILRSITFSNFVILVKRATILCTVLLFLVS